MKRIIIALLLVLVLAIAGCGEPAATEDTTAEAPVTTEASEDSGDAESKAEVKTESGDESFTGSLQALMSKSTPIKCTWEMTTDGQTGKGVIYVKGEKFNSEVDTPEGMIYSISDGEYMYSWSDMQEQGTKFDLKAMQEIGEDYQDERPDVSQQDMQDFQQEYNYKCMPWIVSASKFVPPSDVEFQDMSAMMEQMADFAENFDACAMCDMIPEGPDRSDCLAEC